MTTLADAPRLGLPADDEANPNDNDLRLWGVTTLIGCLEKPALLFWAAEETAKAAIGSRRTWEAMLEERGEEEAVKWLRDARFRPAKDRLSAKDLGTLVHDICEHYALNGSRPEGQWVADRVRSINPKLTVAGVKETVQEAREYADRFDHWLQAFQPEYMATEVAVYHPDYGYAGTADGFMRLGGVPLIFDYKTSRKSVDNQGKNTSPYPESALQLAAYRHAKLAAVWRPRRFERYRRRYYLLSPDEQALAQPVPQVEGGIVIHITPQHCEAWPVRCDETIFEAYLYVQEAARWSFEMSKNVIAAMPMVPPARGEEVA